MNTDSLTQAKAGFVYLIEVVRKGQVISQEIVHNLMPTEGLNHMIGVTLKGQAQISSWYMGLFEGNYTPQASDAAATLPAAAVECTAYDEAARQLLVLGTIASGAVDNATNRSEFTINASKTVYGGFISSSQAKGATTGVLISSVRFASPKVLADDDVLRVTAGFALTSS